MKQIIQLLLSLSLAFQIHDAFGMEAAAAAAAGAAVGSGSAATIAGLYAVAQLSVPGATVGSAAAAAVFVTVGIEGLSGPALASAGAAAAVGATTGVSGIASTAAATAFSATAPATAALVASGIGITTAQNAAPAIAAAAASTLATGGTIAAAQAAATQAGLAAGLPAGAAGAAGAAAAGVGTVAATPPGWVAAAIAVGAGWYTFQATVVLLGITAAIMAGVKGATMKEQADGLCFSHPHFILKNDMNFPVEYRLYSDSFPTQVEYKYSKVADLDIQKRLDTISTESAFENEIKKDDLKLAQKSNVILVRVLKKNGDEVDTFQPVKVDEKGFRYISITLDPKVDQDAKFIYHQLFFERNKRSMLTGVEAIFKDKEGKEQVLFMPGKWDVDHGSVGKGYKAYRATLIQKFDEKNSTLCTRLDVDKRSCTVTPFA